MRITLAYLILNFVLVLVNAQVGVALALAEWDDSYVYLGAVSLAFWGISYLFQVRLFVRYIKQYNEDCAKA